MQQDGDNIGGFSISVSCREPTHGRWLTWVSPNLGFGSDNAKRRMVNMARGRVLWLLFNACTCSLKGRSLRRRWQGRRAPSVSSSLQVFHRAEICRPRLTFGVLVFQSQLFRILPLSPDRITWTQRFLDPIALPAVVRILPLLPFRILHKFPLVVRESDPAKSRAQYENT